jgi:CheY-like chemotaxis protein
MEQEAFGELVRDALGKLEDPALGQHPLGEALAGDGPPPSAAALRQALLDAIDGSGRAGSAPADVRARRAQGLRLRFVEGLRRDEVADLLGVSVRQATRDLDHAVDAVAATLWSRVGAAATHLEQELSHLAAREDAASDLADTLDGALATVGNLAAARGVTLTSAILDTLPAVAIGRTVLRQALLNALTHAVEAAPGRRLTVAATDTAAGVVVRIGVPLAPPPPPPNDAIATAAKLIESAGGTVELGVGSSLVKLTLPAVSLRKILIVDDNPDVVRLFQRYLTGEPYRLIQATSAEGAHRLADELKPDAIVLDVMLPSKDGWEILQELRARDETRAIPVIVCSILPERALALSLGVDDFLAKPVTSASLRAALARWAPAPAATPARS